MVLETMLDAKGQMCDQLQQAFTATFSDQSEK